MAIDKRGITITIDPATIERVNAVRRARPSLPPFATVYREAAELGLAQLEQAVLTRPVASGPPEAA